MMEKKKKTPQVKPYMTSTPLDQCYLPEGGLRSDLSEETVENAMKWILEGEGGEKGMKFLGELYRKAGGAMGLIGKIEGFLDVGLDGTFSSEFSFEGEVERGNESDEDEHFEEDQDFPRGNSVIDFADGTPAPNLVTWLKRLPNSNPDLGYRCEHATQLLETIHVVLNRELPGLKCSLETNGEVETWMAALSLLQPDDGFQCFLAGCLYTADLVIEKPGEKWFSPSKKLQTVIIKDKEILKAHGITADSHRLPLYSTVNTAMRGVADFVDGKRGGEGKVDIFTDPERPQQVQVIKIFQPMIRRVEELIHRLPKKITIVFRGIKGNISSRYKVGSEVVWNAFSSTSAEREAIWSFMGKNREKSTLFVIISSGAASVEFCSVYKKEEREYLYSTNIKFRVSWKLSPTLLRMMGCHYDIVVLKEKSSLLQKSSVKIAALKEVLNQTMKLFKDFLAKYVGGKVGDRERAPAESTKLVLEKIMNWVEINKETRGHLCLLGDGGAGKTSAAVAVLSKLIKDGGDKIFPVFVPLPILKEKLVMPGGIDSFICDSFDLSPTDLNLLGSTYDVILVLDSLDEVGIDELAAKITKSGAASLLEIHPWCFKNTTVLLTTRTDYVKRSGLTPTQLCGTALETIFLQPFTDADIDQYVGKYLGDKEKTEKVLGVLRSKKLLDKVRNPFMLHMFARSCKDQDFSVLHPGRFVENDVYETYLKTVIRNKQEDVSRELNQILHLAEEIACKMLDMNTWELQHGPVIAELLTNHHGMDLGSIKSRLHSLPIRIEDEDDGQSLFTFRHKSLGEYLVARRLWREPVQTLVNLVSRRAWSKDVPNTLRFLENEALRDEDSMSERDLKCRGELLQLLMKTRDRNKSTQKTRIVASNAMAYMTACRYNFERDNLSGLIVENSDCRNSVFVLANFTSARFENCWMEGTEMYKCVLTSSDWTGSSFGIPLPPLNSHSGKITSITMARGGALLLSTSEDHTFRAFDLNTATQIYCLPCPHPVTSMVLTPDERIVILSYSNIFEVRCRVEFTLIKKVETESKISCIVLHGGLIYTGHITGTIYTWALGSGKQRKKITMEQIDPTHITTISTGKDTVLIGFKGSHPVILNGGNPNRKSTYTDHHEQGVTCSVLTSDGLKAVTGGKEKTVFIWDTIEMRTVARLEGHSASITSITLDPRELRIVSGSKDDTIRVWELMTGVCCLKLEGHSRYITSLHITPDGSRLASGSNDHTIRIWDLSTSKEPPRVESHSRWVTCVAADFSEKRIFSGSDDSTVRVWNGVTGREIVRFDTPGYPQALHHSTDNHLYCVTNTKTMLIWNLSGMVLVRTVQIDSSYASFSDSAEYFATFRSEAVVVVYQQDRHCEAMTPILLQHASPILSLIKVSSHADVVVTYLASEVLCMWGKWKGGGVNSPQPPVLVAVKNVLSLDTSRNGGVAVVGCKSEICLYDTRSGATRHRFPVELTSVVAVKISDCEKIVVSGCSNKTVLIFNATTGTATHTLCGNSDTITGIALSPTSIVTASKDKTIRVYRLVSRGRGGSQNTMASILTIGERNTCVRTFSCIGANMAKPDSRARLL